MKDNYPKKEEWWGGERLVKKKTPKLKNEKPSYNQPKNTGGERGGK